MRNLHHLFISLGTLFTCAVSVPALAQPLQQHQMPSQWNSSDSHSFRIGIVDTKKCLEQSKLGKQELANIEKMRNQMESVLQEKGKTIEDIENKLNDEDYMDSISSEAEVELKRKKRTLLKEGSELQAQYMQTLEHARSKTIQKMTEAINKASTQIAQESVNSSEPPLSAIFSDEACTYYVPSLDVTNKVVAKMDQAFDMEQTENQNKNR